MTLITYRRNVLPRSFLDLLPFLFLLTIIPVTYWFEVWIALPALFPFYTNTATFCFLFAAGHFLLLNILGNLFGVIAVDTSIRGKIMPPLDSEWAAGYCDKCISVTPPRSYHCPTCRICILRRDHHCLFTACCIGHFNYRYFLMFLFHMFFATAFCLPFNISFLWNFITWGDSIAIVKVILPVVMLKTGIGFTREQGYLVVCALSLAGMLFIGMWFYFHIRLTISGRLVHELRKNITLYDRGFRENMKEALGIRWYLVWLSPFIHSELPSDGIHFLGKNHAS